MPLGTVGQCDECGAATSTWYEIAHGVDDDPVTKELFEAVLETRAMREKVTATAAISRSKDKLRRNGLKVAKCVHFVRPLWKHSCAQKMRG